MDDAAILRITGLSLSLVALVTGSWLPFVAMAAFSVVWGMGCVLLGDRSARPSAIAAAA